MKINDIFNLEQYDQAYNFVKDNPELSIIDLGDGKYQITKPQAQSPAEKAFMLRTERNFLLQETDKYLISDFPISTEELDKIKNYRKYLRDIPQDTNFPNIQIQSLDEFIK